MVALLSRIANAYDFKVDGLCYNINSDSISVTLTWETSPGSDYNGFSTTTYTGLDANVEIPEQVTYNGTTYNVTAINSYCFNVCQEIESISMPKTIKVIGDFAFNKCIKLTSVTIPSSVISIGRNPFSDCPAIEMIEVEKDNPHFDSRNNCNAIIATSSNVLMSGCKSTKIPYGVSSIGDYAFYGCTGLESIVIPHSVTSICDYSFCYCTGLKGSFKIPNSVVAIGRNAIGWGFDLTSVVIGNSVETMGDAAFFYCGGDNGEGNHIKNVYCLMEYHPVWYEHNAIGVTYHPLSGFWSSGPRLYVPEPLYYTADTPDNFDNYLYVYFEEILTLPANYSYDVNVDAAVTSSDVTALYNYLLNADNTYLATGDVNGDGDITAADITAVYNILLGN